MVPPSSSVDSIGNPASINYRVSNIHALKNRLQSCSQIQFTGRLTLGNSTQNRQWSLFFQVGRLIGGTGQPHPVRRWCRQLSQHCPEAILFPSRELHQPYWQQDMLAGLAKRGKVTRQQLTLMVEGTLVELLFDMLHLLDQHPLDTQLIHGVRPRPQHTSRVVFARADSVWQQAEQAWRQWQQAGLSGISPNLAPVIWDSDELRRHTSFLVYHNLNKLLDGDRTLRDLAVTLKRPLLPLTQSLRPYLQKEMMGLVAVDDRSGDRGMAAQPGPEAACQPLVAYIEDSRFDSLTMSQILAQVGCRAISVRDPVQALPILLEHKPTMIFLDLLMPVMNGYEVCAQIRRVLAFQETPVIIVTSSDGIVDQVRARLVGASGFISKPIEPEKVLAVLRNHLPTLNATTARNSRLSARDR